MLVQRQQPFQRLGKVEEPVAQRSLNRLTKPVRHQQDCKRVRTVSDLERRLEEIIRDLLRERALRAQCKACDVVDNDPEFTAADSIPVGAEGTTRPQSLGDENNVSYAVQLPIGHTSSNPVERRIQSSRYPNYSLKDRRLATFSKWQSPVYQDVEALAEAGFFYEGCDDMVVCFFCGGALRGWEKDDVPLVEHARWFPECNYVKLSMEPTQYSAVQELQKECLGETSEPGDGDERKDELVSEVFDKTIVEFYGKFGIGHEKLREAVTYLLHRGLSLDIIKEKHQIEEALKAVTRINKEKLAGAKSTQEPVDDTCAICFVEQKSVLFMPCQHLVACVNCASSLSECPMCRKEITDRIRAFLC